MRKTLPDYITKPLNLLTYEEWELLCDRCGLCCIHKVEDEKGHLYLTNVACKFLDIENIHCQCYGERAVRQSLCQSLSFNNISQNLSWLPQTCAYRRRYENKLLPDWHPLITNDYGSVQKAGLKIQDKVVSENLFPMIDWEKHIVPDNYFEKDLH